MTFLFFQPEYVWVSQETVTASSSVTTLTAYDLTMTTNLPDPFTMKPTETFFFEAMIYSTNPATNLEFEIGELLGDVDALHFGRPAVTFGSSFRFTKSFPADDPYNQVMYLKADKKNHKSNERSGRQTPPPHGDILQFWPHCQEAAMEADGCPQP